MKTTPAAETSLEKPLDIPSFSNSIQFNLTVSVGLLAFVKSFNSLILGTKEVKSIHAPPPNLKKKDI